MTLQIAAIYDNGVFRPLEPLALADQAHVKLTVNDTANPRIEAEPSLAVDPKVLAAQQAALEELRRAIDKVPQHKNNDGWSVRQHDELLYGWRK